jgi:hypothetical protein
MHDRLLASLLLVACGLLPACRRSPPPRRARHRDDATLEVFPYPGSRHFCTGRVQPPAPAQQVNWDAYATTAQTWRVVQHYQDELGPEPHRHQGEADFWRFPVEHPTTVLEVVPASIPGPWVERCGPAPAGARTVVMISQALFSPQMPLPAPDDGGAR